MTGERVGNDSNQTTAEGYGLEVCELQFETVGALQDHLYRVFGERNAEHLNTMEDCIKLFAVSIRDLRQARREQDKSATDLALARLGSRIFAFTHLDAANITVHEGLEAKYPIAGCAYCYKSPCVCGDTRKEVKLAWGEVGARTHWDLADWQMCLEGMYGANNRARGFDYVTARLSDELTEITALSYFAPRLGPTELTRHVKLELADLMAWTLAAGNILGVNVQAAVEARYSEGCPTCNSPQCQCGEDQFDHVYDILG